MLIIDGITYERIIFSDRHEILRPVGGWPILPPKVFNLRKALIDNNVAKVCVCGSTTRLDAHHIKPVRYLKNKNGHTYQDPHDDHSASNGQWLCRKCHNNLHHKN